ncbi:Rrf2 family transcriptional regulator [Pseudomonas sp. HR96]|uniref:Rrf2 family transcriptional regulator n=1 Tax=Pseudomonas sp. HR96 TaxID=1027966 RepID=UPI002A74FD90|nr:Rrf2 family transcriptional regulator [Pseudomonas sp. HR96]WPO97771.1 Rrf2 family transcriptional regulator [Pseudomonas sp. HR96]
MSQTNIQFSVASHIMASLGVMHPQPVRSAELAESVNADPSFVRRVISKLAKAGLVSTTRGKSGACALARAPAEITLLDVYKASLAPESFAVHAYPVAHSCQVSRHIKGCLGEVLKQAQDAFEQGLAQQSLERIVASIKTAG